MAEGDSHVKATQPRHDCNFGGDLIVTVEGRHSGRRTVGANPHVHPDAEGRPRGRTGGICGPYGEQSGLKQQRPKHPQRENDLLAVPGTFLRTPGEAPEARLHPGSRTDQPGLQAKGQVRLPFVSERRVSRAVRPHLSRGRPRYVTASAAEATNCELRFAPPSPTPARPARRCPRVPGSTTFSARSTDRMRVRRRFLLFLW